MNKQQLIGNLKSFCQKHDINIDDVWLSYDAACVMLGVKEEASIIDLNVPESVYEKFLDGKYPTREELDPRTDEITSIVSVEGIVDMHLGYRSTTSSSLMETDGITHTDHASTLHDKIERNSVEDHKDVAELSNYLRLAKLDHLKEILNSKYDDCRYVRKAGKDGEKGVYIEVDGGLSIELHRLDNNINMVYMDGDNNQHRTNYKNVDVFFCTLNASLEETNKNIHVVSDARYTLVEILYNHEVITMAERLFWRQCNQVNSRVVDAIRLVESKYCQIYSILEILYIRGVVSICVCDGETKVIVYGTCRQGDSAYINRKAALVRQQLMMLLGTDIDIIVLTGFDIRLSGHAHTDVVAYFDLTVNPVVYFNT